MTNEMELPNGWKKTVLGEIVEKQSRKVLPTDFPDAKFIGMDCIEPHTLRPTFLYAFKEFKSAGNWFKKNQILYGRMRPYLNKVYKAEFDGACSGEFIVMECFDALFPDLLQYILHARNFVQFVNEKTSGDRPRVSYDEIAEYPILLPPRNEQYRIVAKIEELFSELDAGVESLKKAQAQLKAYRRSVLKHAFEGRLTNNKIQGTELPNDWKIRPLDEIGKIETGNTPSKSNQRYYGNDYPFYKPTDLEAGNNVRFANDNLSLEGLKQARYLPENSILVTCIGATIGKTGIIRRAGASNQQINSIIPYEGINPDFVYYQTISPDFQNAIKDNASSTTLPILNKRKFRKLELKLCPIEEQHSVVAEIETRFSVCDNLEETITASLKQSEALRQSILKKGFEGNLVEQDENDEPVAMLLGRIAKEREEFLANEKLNKKNLPRVSKTTRMAERLKSILKMLEENSSPIDTYTLWQSTEYKNDIDKFYAEVKELLESGKIAETQRRGNESFLVLADSK